MDKEILLHEGLSPEFKKKVDDLVLEIKQHVANGLEIRSLIDEISKKSLMLQTDALEIKNSLCQKFMAPVGESELDEDARILTRDSSIILEFRKLLGKASS